MPTATELAGGRAGIRTQAERLKPRSQPQVQPCHLREDLLPDRVVHPALPSSQSRQCYFRGRHIETVIALRSRIKWPLFNETEYFRNRCHRVSAFGNTVTCGKSSLLSSPFLTSCLFADPALTSSLPPTPTCPGCEEHWIQKVPYCDRNSPGFSGRVFPNQIERHSRRTTSIWASEATWVHL